MLDFPLIKAGFALHRLHPRTKRPIGDDWSEKPVWTAAQLRKTYREGDNIGVRLGEPSRVGNLYLHVFDIDVREPALAHEAFAALRIFAPAYQTFPAVKSGSEGPSEHVYFLASRPFRSRKLAHSDTFFVDTAGHKHWNWELELFGTGKQTVLPPSIHPDSGRPYRWLREFDFELVDMGLGPVIDADIMQDWAPAAATPADDDDLRSFVRSMPADVNDDQVNETLALLPLADWCEDRDGWLKVGMALHHQTEGAPKGLALWNAFSKQSPKYDEKDQVRVWKSFESKPGGVRFPTLLQAAKVERLRRIDDEVEIDDDDEEDLIGEAPKPEPLAWVSMLDVTQDGGYKATLHNLELIIRNDVRFKGIVRLNEFTLNECYRGEPGFKAFNKKRAKPTKQLTGPIWRLQDEINGDIWGDTRSSGVRSAIEAPRSQGGYGIKVSDRDLGSAIALAAAENGFHPIQEYLESLVWDGKPRLDTLFIRYLGVADSSYHRAIARLPLIAAVARVFEPGHKFDFVPIIEGPQGCRKSTFVATLGKHWASELNGDFSDRKALVEKMQGAWVLEIPELAGFTKHDIADIKAAISAPSDKVRLPYKAAALEYRRQSVFIGTTNDSEYLRDSTGGRRFWPVKCLVGHIDIDGLVAEVDQLWAEAYVAYRAMRERHPDGTLPLFLSDSEAAAEALILQEDRRGETSEEIWAAKIEVWLDTPETDDSGFTEEDEDLIGVPAIVKLRNEVTLSEIWVQCLQREASQLNSGVTQQLARSMKHVSTFFRVAGPVRTKDGGRQRVYRRIETAFS